MSDFKPKDYWESRLREHPGLVGVGYSSFGACYNRWLYRLRRRVFLRRMRTLAPDLGRLDVLDVGSGTGFWVDAWAELGVGEVVGSDLTATAVEDLRRRFGDREIVQLDIGGDLAPLDGRRFDVVSAMDVLFHIVDDALYERAVANIHDALRPGGRLVMCDLFVHGPVERAETMVTRPLADVERVLADNALEVVERRPFSVLMNYPGDCSHAWLKRLWRLMWRGACLTEPTGLLWGAALYPLEAALVACKSESPSTELMICRRTD